MMEQIARTLGMAQNLIQKGEITAGKALAASALRQIELLELAGDGSEWRDLAKGDAFRLLGDNANAEAAYRAATSCRSGDSAPSWMRLLEIQLERNASNQEIIQTLSAAIIALPHIPLFYSNRGRLLALNHDYPAAAQDLILATQLQPNNHDAWNNLGVVQQRLGDVQNARKSHQQAWQLAPDNMEYLLNLAIATADDNDLPTAIALYEKIISQKPDMVSAYWNLGTIYHGQRQFDKAEAMHLAAIQYGADSANIYLNLGHLYRDMGRRDDSIVAYQKCLEREPTHEIARYMIATLSGESPAAPPNSYVRTLFDFYAQDFEDKLVGKLNYQAPNLLRDLLLGYDGLDFSGKNLHLLDLGCGTGLFGDVFQHYVKVMDGVDLSPAMLAKAETKKIYRQLVADDITHYMMDKKHCYHLIVAADVFVYLGDLEPVLTACRHAIIAPGAIAFSVEKAPDDITYRLMGSGRYEHGKNYLLNIAQQTGFNVEKITEVTLRMNAGKPVIGYVVLLVAN